VNCYAKRLDVHLLINLATADRDIEHEQQSDLAMISNSGRRPYKADAPGNDPIYDKNYYETMRGNEPNALYRKVLTATGINFADRRVLDVGCGRGEMITMALEQGAIYVVGLDISVESMHLASSLVDSLSLPKERYELMHMGLDQYADQGQHELFDHILMIDFVEHVEQTVLLRSLKAARELLAPGGSLVVHTFPNLFWHTLLTCLLKIAKPDECERITSIHVNVQTPKRLRLALNKSGFTDVAVWVDSDFIHASSFYINMKESLLKSIVKTVFNDLMNKRAMRWISRKIKIDSLLYMSIYGVARK